MVDERESPSAEWREVYREMEADPSAEEATRPCPDCGHTCENVLRDVYECEEHGVFRASADAEDDAASLEGSADETAVTDETAPEETVTDDAETTIAADADETAPEEAEQTDADVTPDDSNEVENSDEVESRAREPAD
jgi:hypothetical protein